MFTNRVNECANTISVTLNGHLGGESQTKIYYDPGQVFPHY